MKSFLLLFILITPLGCGFTIPNLPIPIVEQTQRVEFNGEVSEFYEPLDVSYLCCPEFKFDMEVTQTDDSGSYNAFRKVSGCGDVCKCWVDICTSAKLTFDNYHTNIIHLDERDSLSCKIDFSKIWPAGLSVDDIKLSESSKNASFNENDKFVNGMKKDMFNWLLWMFYLPNKPIYTGATLELTELCPLTDCCRLSNGRETIPCGKISMNNSYVSGITSYNNRDHIVFIIDFVGTRAGESDYLFSAANPLSLYTTGYILVDKKTGLHSLGYLKTQLSIRHHFSTKRYRIEYNFKIELS